MFWILSACAKVTTYISYFVGLRSLGLIVPEGLGVLDLKRMSKGNNLHLILCRPGDTWTDSPSRTRCSAHAQR